MTTESVAPETLHAWAICLQAAEEARRRGDRRYGTDHIVLALFEDPLDRSCWASACNKLAGPLIRSITKPWVPWAWGRAPTLPNCRCAPCRRSQGSETSRKKIASASRPRQRKVLEEASKPNRRKRQLTAQQCASLDPRLSNQPDPAAAVLLGALSA